MGSMRACHAHIENEQGLEFLVSVAEWSYDNHSQFQAYSYYSVKVIHI